ncbi:uncharacterized protein [Watersipora subatra]|uniref:uncharacterized protein n=1 Tax=Watersipora subatra TaxID=2589382 RepID=UPI00355AFB36
MTKNRWKVIMPKRGSLDFVIQHVHKYYTECIDVVITRNQLSSLEKLKSRLAKLSLGDDLQFRHERFRPNSYLTVVSLPLPHTRQLERPQRSGSPLHGGYRPIYNTENWPKAKSAKQNAKNLICKEVLIDHLGETDFEKEILDYGSSACFLYALSNKLGLPMPGIVTHCTQDIKPVKYTGIVCSHLIKEPGLVKLKGQQLETYGGAVESAFSLLDSVLTELRFEQQFPNLEYCHNPLTYSTTV